MSNAPAIVGCVIIIGIGEMTSTIAAVARAVTLNVEIPGSILVKVMPTLRVIVT
jgi:hypothetical protein